jgi:hypothetical protein
MLFYGLLFLVGLVAGVFSPIESILVVLKTLEPVTLTALVASLLVPFAGFASTERWQKFVLQYGIIPLFGVYTVVLWRTQGVTGLIILFCASAVHAGYWMSSIHSRMYRMEMFKMLPNKPAELVEAVVRLCVEGHPEEADKLVKEFIGKVK